MCELFPFPPHAADAPAALARHAPRAAMRGCAGTCTHLVHILSR